MRIGILVPSIYMYGDKFRDRISVAMELAVNLANGLVKKSNEVFFFSGPNVPVNARVITADEDLLSRDFRLDDPQDLPPEANAAVSMYEKKKFFELSVAQKGFQFARENNLDLLHFYHIVGGASHYLTELSQIPVLYTIHSPVPPVDTLEEWRFKRFHRQNFITISNSQTRHFQEQIPKINIVEKIYHGMKIDEFTYVENPDDYFLSIGRLAPEKGVAVAIQVALQTSVRLQIATHLNSVVEKSEYYQKDILPHLDEKNIYMKGFVKGKEKIELLQHAKAMLFPIQWEESFGMVLTEAMACGTPVIAYNRGSVPEVVKDGVTGFIIDPDDEDRPGKGSWIIKKQGIEGLVEAVKRIGEIDRRACRKHVEENFTVEKMVDGYESVYKKVLGI